MERAVCTGTLLMFRVHALYTYTILYSGIRSAFSLTPDPEIIQIGMRICIAKLSQGTV